MSRTICTKSSSNQNLFTPMPNLSYRNKLNHLMKISKRKYYDNYFFENINDSKKIWKGVKQIVIFKPQTSSKQIILPLEECEITDSVEVPNAFNSYFSSIGNDVAGTIPSVRKKSKRLLTQLYST